MNVIWADDALDDLESIRAYIADDDPVVAKRVVRRIYRYADSMLQAHPAIGRAGRIAGTRELIVPKTPFIVPYRVSDNAIYVLRVYHAARRWPDAL